MALTRFPAVAFALVAALPSAAPAQVAQPAINVSDDADLTALFDADQATRKTIDPTKPIDIPLARRMIAEDAARRATTRSLLAAGRIRTAADFYHAAFLMQHGVKAQDYLLAHSLALAAAARGRTDASWIAAATLDRYLMAIGQPQIYGTQYVRDTRTAEAGLTMEPYDRTLVPDELRIALGVPTQAEQDARLSTVAGKTLKP